MRINKFVVLTLMGAISQALAAQPLPRPTPAAQSALVSKAPAAGRNSTNRRDPRTMPGKMPLVSQTQVRSAIERFRAAFPRMGKPRFLIYVNRELVEDLAGMKKSARPEQITTARSLLNSNLDPSSKRTSAPAEVADSEDPFSTGPGEDQPPVIGMENRCRLRDRDIPTLADKQTALKMERWFGRPLRSARFKAAATNAPCPEAGAPLATTDFTRRCRLCLDR